jgi:hypothetical protein
VAHVDDGRRAAPDLDERAREHLPEVLAEVEAALEGDRGDDGQLHLTQQVRYTTARVA